MAPPTRWPIASGDKGLSHNPENPGNGSTVDRFVLSSRPAACLLYSLLHLTGYTSVGLEDLKQFRSGLQGDAGATRNLRGPRALRSPPARSVRDRQRGGPGDRRAHIGRQVQTGLGSNLVRTTFTYVIMGTACHQEASPGGRLPGRPTWACKLIALYDDNQHSPSMATPVCPSPRTCSKPATRLRLARAGTVAMGNADDLAAITQAIEAHKASHRTGPA